jgi:hypothetical protein
MLKEQLSKEETEKQLTIDEFVALKDQLESLTINHKTTKKEVKKLSQHLSHAQTELTVEKSNSDKARQLTD